MSKILDSIIIKIQRLNDETEYFAPVDTKLCFGYGHTDCLEIPLNNKTRKLLKALLIEIGREECKVHDTRANEFRKLPNENK